MLDKILFVKYLKHIELVYKMKFTQEEAQIWYSCLKLYEDEEFVGGIKEMMLTVKTSNITPAHIKTGIDLYNKNKIDKLISSRIGIACDKGITYGDGRVEELPNIDLDEYTK